GATDLPTAEHRFDVVMSAVHPASENAPTHLRRVAERSDDEFERSILRKTAVLPDRVHIDRERTGQTQILTAPVLEDRHQLQRLPAPGDPPVGRLDPVLTRQQIRRVEPLTHRRPPARSRSSRPRPATPAHGPSTSPVRAQAAPGPAPGPRRW